MVYYRLETETWSDRGFSTQKLDRALNLVRLMLELDITYDYIATSTPHFDGYAGQIIRTVSVREGSNVPIKLYGKDLHILHDLFTKSPHSATTIPKGVTGQTTITTTSELKFLIPIHLFRSPLGTYIEIEWGVSTDLGVDYTVKLGTLNGTYEQTEQNVIPHRIIPDVSEVGVKNTQVLDIYPEGALAQILIISRASASPYSRRNALSSIELKIEGILQSIDADNMLHEYAVFTGQKELTGVYLINLPEKPIIGHYSKLYLYGDATATDYSVYYFFVSPAETPVVELKETLTKAPIRAVLERPAVLPRGAFRPVRPAEIGISPVLQLLRRRRVGVGIYP